MPFTITKIQRLKFGPWTLNAKMTQYTTMESEIFTPEVSALTQFKKKTIHLNPKDPKLSLKSIFEYPLSLNLLKEGGGSRKGDNWIKNLISDSLYNDVETRFDFDAAETKTKKEFGRIFSLVIFGQYTTISLKNVRLNENKLSALIRDLHENTVIQNLELPNNLPSDFKENDLEEVKKVLDRNKGKTKLNRWYTNPFKNIPIIATAAMSTIFIFFLGIPASMMINFLFIGYSLSNMLNYLSNKRQQKFLDGYQKLHPNTKHSDKPSESEKAAYTYGLEAGKGWFPYVKTCLRHPISTTWNYSAYLAGVGESMAKADTKSFSPKNR